MIFTNDFSPVIFSIGPLDLRWYGVCFVAGLVLTYLTARWAFKKNGFSISALDSLAVYLMLGLIMGARIGHVLFYNFDYFSAHPLEILMIWKGGLASHGAVIGLFIAYFIWIFVHKVRFSKYADALSLSFPLAAMFVRIGNFFNSEIVGVPVKGGGSANFGVIFKRLGEDFPRHPAQLYEAALSFLIFAVMFFLYKRYYKKAPKLFFMFFYMLTYFLGRFFIEYYKDLHALPDSFPLSMGQVLSILPVLAAGFYFIRLIVARGGHGKRT